MELKCHVQHYEWGKLGSESLVAELVKSADGTVEIDDSKPYAELWLGTHPNGPSTIIERGILLSEYLKDNEDAIGPIVKKKFGAQIPFLMKVLSVRKALSIQVHPDKALAEQLHKEFPDVYKDDNHKPELALALTPFEVLCAFRPVAEIREFFNKIPELRGLVSANSLQQLERSGDAEGDGSAAIEAVFSDLMLSEKEPVAKSLQAFLDRMKNEEGPAGAALVARLAAQFPGDAGCWAPGLLRHELLQPGQALFLEPGVPHAYITGDCIEVMSCSDNVIRAGLTPKPRDVRTLLRALRVAPRRAAPTHAAPLAPTRLDHCCSQWAPPVPDFKLLKIVVPGGASYNTPAAPAPGLLLVRAGRGEARDAEPVALRPGSAVFLKASRQLTLEAASEGLEAYLATANVS